MFIGSIHNVNIAKLASVPCKLSNIIKKKKLTDNEENHSKLDLQVIHERDTNAAEIAKYTQLLQKSLKDRKPIAITKKLSMPKAPSMALVPKKLISSTDNISRDSSKLIDKANYCFRKNEFQTEKNILGQIMSVCKVSKLHLFRKKFQNFRKIDEISKKKAQDFIEKQQKQYSQEKVKHGPIENKNKQKPKRNWLLCFGQSTSNKQIMDSPSQAIVKNLVNVCKSLLEVEDLIVKLGPINEDLKNRISFFALSSWQKPKDSKEDMIISKVFEFIIEESKQHHNEEIITIPSSSTAKVQKTSTQDLNQQCSIQRVKCEDLTMRKPSTSFIPEIQSTNIYQDKQLSPTETAKSCRQEISRKSQSKSKLQLFKLKTDKNKIELINEKELKEKNPVVDDSATQPRKGFLTRLFKCFSSSKKQSTTSFTASNKTNQPKKK